MSAFAVYGVSLPQCRQRAARATKMGGLSQSEWEATVENRAAELFASAKMRRRISSTFDAPQYARDFIRAAPPSEFSALSVYAYQDSGKKNKKTGKKVMRWLPWADK